MKRLRNIKLLPITSLLLNFVFVHQAFAETTPLTPFPANPGVTLTGSYGDISSLYADSLIPIIGRPGSSFLYINPQGIFHNTDEYSASLGTGYRLLQNHWGILGGSLFTDYNRTSSHAFWFVSPGLQRLGDRFDLSINGYIPISNQRINTGQEFADDTGDTSSVTFSGHDQIDQLVNTFESTGPGADFTVGVRLPLLKENTKLYVGTYYFAPKNNDSILGGAVRLEAPVNRFFSVVASEAYDGVMHNTAKIGLSIALGGRSSGYDYQGQLSDRLVDPVQRHLAATAGGSATTEPALEGIQYTGKYAIERSNIWFFTSNGSAGQCTADSPCQLSQDEINSINSTNPAANIYVETGQYTLPGKLILNEGQSMFGRADNFTAAAADQNAPALYGSLELKGDNSVEDLKLFNDGSQPVGIRIDDGAQNITLDRVSVGDPGDNPSQAYKTGIQLGNQDSVYIENSQIYAYSNANDNSGGLVSGVKLDGVSDSYLRIDNSTIRVSTDVVGDPVGIFVGNDQATQGYAQNNQVTLSKDNIQVLGQHDSNSAFGVYLGNYFSDNDSGVSNNHLNIQDSQINVRNINDRSSFGVFAGNYQQSAPAFNNNYIEIDGSSISTSSLGDAYGIFEGMINGENSRAVNNSLIVNNSNIKAVSETANAYGVELEGYNSNFTLTNNVIQAIARNGNIVDNRVAYGVDLKAENDILNMNGNRIISQGEGSNVLVAGFADGFYFSDVPNNNVVNASSNFIKASSDSDNANVNGVLIQNGWDTIHFDNDKIVATGSGKNAAVFGVNVAGNNNTINITNSQIDATATGLKGDAAGVIANSGSGLYSSASDNLINLSGNTISAISASGKAEGVSDPLADQNHDVWNVSPDNKIMVHSSMP
jgi:hypothetical protein